MTNPFASTSLSEGQSTHRPPLFNGTNYNYWKARMKIYMQTDYSLWRIVQKGIDHPTKKVDNEIVFKDEKDWTASEVANVELNAKAMNMLYCALDSNEFNRVSACETAKEIWDKLEVTHEGTSQVKESKIDLLVHKYELFKMLPNESITAMFTRFTDIINGLKSLGKIYSNVDLVRKVLRSLPKEWGPKVTAIIEAKQDLTKYSLDELMGSLMTHELTLNKEDEEQTPKKKGLALKCSSSRTETGDDSEAESSDEEMALFTRKFKKFMKKKKEFGKRAFKKDSFKNDNKKDPIICFECKKPGHIKAECPQIKETNKKMKKRAMLAAWGNSSDEDSSDEEGEQANLCLMAREDVKVNNFDDLDEPLTYEELESMFDEMCAKYKELGSKNNILKKENASLISENLSLKEEICFLKERENGASSSKGPSLEVENDSLKRQVESLNSTLSKFVKGKETLDVILGSQRCVYDKAGIGYDPDNNQKTYQKFFRKPISSTLPFTKCNYCGKRGHVSSSCPMKRKSPLGVRKTWVPRPRTPPYYRPKQYWRNNSVPYAKKRNFQGGVRKAWVPKLSVANPQGPKKVWVPKTNV